LDLDVHRAASGILRIVMSNMAAAIRSMTSETGDDPRDFSMLCFGGGGAMYGAHLMDELSLPAAIVPILPSAFSAWGMLMVDLRHDVVQTIAQRLDGIEAGKLEEHFASLEKKGWEQLVREAVPEDRRQLFRSADMRYAGQEHSVSVPVPSSLA